MDKIGFDVNEKWAKIETRKEISELILSYLKLFYKHLLTKSLLKSCCIKMRIILENFNLVASDI